MVYADYIGEGWPGRENHCRSKFKTIDKVEPSTFSTPADADVPGQEANTVPGPETDKLLPHLPAT